jgi:hypothetical protein
MGIGRVERYLLPADNNENTVAAPEREDGAILLSPQFKLAMGARRNMVQYRDGINS